MGWFGKLAGGTFGFLFGGPIGAVCGAVLGHTLFDKTGEMPGMTRDYTSFASGEEAQAAYFISLFSITIW